MKPLKDGDAVVAIIDGFAAKCTVRETGATYATLIAVPTRNARAALRSRGRQDNRRAVLLDPTTEGVWWCRGWDENAALAMLAANAL